MEYLSDFFEQLRTVRSHGFTRTGFFDLAVVFINTATLCMLVPKLVHPNRLLSLNLAYRAGLGILVMGLAAQIPISICRLLNYRLPDALAGMWSLKDIGFFVFVFAITYLGAGDKFVAGRNHKPNED